MARAAAKTRRARTSEDEAGSSSVLQECLGVALIGGALLLGLALGSFSPADPVFEAASVQNRAGAVGASAAALLFGLFGMGAVVVVAAMAFLGGRLVLGLGVPKLVSRFWVGVPLLLITAATLPPLLAQAFPGALAGAPAGWLGRTLGCAQGLMLGAWGALLLNGVLALIGVLSLTGVSTGSGSPASGSPLGGILGTLP
ncbi:MAG: DNA translocase FtsK 4TM domain-containing protein, partial [Myxococcota bacterium]